MTVWVGAGPVGGGSGVLCHGVRPSTVSQAECAPGRGSHYIEESIGVYLMRDWDGTDRWVLDRCRWADTGWTRAPRTCPQQRAHVRDQAACDALRDRMDGAALPTAKDLLHCLGVIWCGAGG